MADYLGTDWQSYARELREENKKLNKRLTHNTSFIVKLRKQLAEVISEIDGIMEDPNSQHIQGCNAYEKFGQAMCELNYDEQWIKELKEENKNLRKEIKKLKAQ
jgi:cell shape-determining protein MreC